MAGQVGKLTLEAVIKGFEDVQGLGKALALVDKSSKHTDRSISQLASKIKTFAAQNIKTTDSIRGQVAAFTNLRKQVGFNSDAYKEFSKDIGTLNKELTSQIVLEKKLETQQKFNRRVRADFTLKQRLGTLGSDLTGEPSKQARRIKELDFALGELNEEQLEKLGLDREISVQSDTYRRVVEALTDQTNKYSAAVTRQKLAAAEALAMDRQRHSLDKERLALDNKRFKNFRIGMGPGMGSLGQISTSTQVAEGGIGPVQRDTRLQDKFRNQPWIARFLQSHIETSNWQKMMGEKRSMPLPLFTTPTKTFADNIYDPKSPTKIFGPQFKPHKSKFGLQEDYLKGLEFPKTEAGYGAKIAELSSNLKDLTLDTDEYRHAKKLLNKTEKEFDDLLKKSTQTVTQAAGKTVNLTQKLLPPSKQSILEGQAFKAPEVKKVAKSVEQLTNEFNKNTKVGKTNINTLSKQRSRLEKIRNELDPTSAAFKRTTQAIQQTDKALAKLNSNKFSGANLRRTGQSILGAGFVGGPAGFLGAGLGAGIEALRPGGDMAGGAITGGLVASQVLTPISQAIGGSTEYASQIEKAQIALRGITKTTENYDVAQQAITKAVETYNVPQEVAIKGMTRLSAAVLGAGGNIYNAAEAFLNTTVAIKGTAGSADDVKSAITAMVQIYSKGKVSAEELSGQLGERFPAAVTKFAKANDISTQALQKSLKDGTVGLDMLSKFVTSLGKEYAPLAKKIAESNEEAGARSQIAMNKMRIAVGNSLKGVGAEFQIIGAELLTALVPALKSIAEIAATVFGGLAAIVKFVVNNFHEFASVAAVAGGVAAGVALKVTGLGAALAAMNLVAVVKQIGAMVVALKTMTIAQIKANLAAWANPYVALAGGLTLAAIAAHRFATANDRLAEKLKSGDAKEDDITKAFKERLRLQKEMKKIETSTAFKYRNEEDRAAAIAKLQVQYDSLTDAIEAYRKAQNGSLEDMDEWTKKFDELMSQGEKTYSGLQGGWEKFADSVKNSGEEIANVTASWFDRAADSLANFVMTGKLKFKEFARSVIADIAKMIAKQLIFNMIAGFGNMFGPSVGTQVGGGLGGHLKKLKLIRNATGNAYGKNGIVPFYKGGIVNSPTLFPFAKGTGLMGEAGPEAIIPLQRGKNGKLGVAGGGGTTTVNVSVDAKGTKVEGDGKQMAQLGKMLGSAIEAELIKQKRPGGLLA